MPPPHPTSSTSFPTSHLGPSSSCTRSNSPFKNSILAGFMRCSNPNSPVGSHQCADKREKCAISSDEIVLVERGPSVRAGRVEEKPRDGGTDDGVVEGLLDDESSHDEPGELDEARLRKLRGRTAFRTSMLREQVADEEESRADESEAKL